MSLITEQFDRAYQNAIKAVGVGKRGSRALEPALIVDLSNEIRHAIVPEAALGAILGALMMKGVTQEERQLEKVLAPGIFDDAQVMFDYLRGPHPLPDLQG